VGHNPTSQIGLKTTDQQKHAVIKTAFDPTNIGFAPVDLLSVVFRASLGEMRDYRDAKAG
jgi:hypothetical protein